MKIIKPKKLKVGDVIGVISPASSPSDLSKIETGVNYLEKLGYKVELGKNVGKEYGYLAGTDVERLADFYEMFENKKIKAIFCLRGGYGSARILDKINFPIIKSNPKIFVGYSDITALQLAIFRKTRMITFAGPMVATDFSGDVNEFAEENFWRVISSDKKIGRLHNPGNQKFFALNNGRCEGSILGGNLALIASLLGTEFVPKFKNSILLLEDIGEAPYRVDRLLNQLKLNGILNEVSGIILGRFVDCYEDDKEKKTLTLNQVIEDYLSNLKIPVMYNFSHGHIKENLTIPLGLNCKMNATKSFVEFNESAVI